MALYNWINQLSHFRTLLQVHRARRVRRVGPGSKDVLLREELQPLPLLRGPRPILRSNSVQRQHCLQKQTFLLSRRQGCTFFPSCRKPPQSLETAQRGCSHQQRSEQRVICGSFWDALLGLSAQPDMCFLLSTAFTLQRACCCQLGQVPSSS